ncbi:Zinc finger CCCH domain-containing protein 1 [Sesamum alatum]|uniref:Zinc finger CCCH domain-containing protein 1 n=1 Tax=Sesamum alatum TaxID=300844 RepID=A0AAE1XUY0_9LAMI|nr:Zinc finger CCCH domain-containing protein 1 [Sesamum alatum]
MQGDEADGGGAAAAASATDEGVTVCNFFRKPSKGKNIRKRTALEEGEGDDEDSKVESSVVYNKKKQAAPGNKLHFSSGPLKHFKESEVEKPKASVFEYESSKEIQVHNDSRATATLETETDFSRDARAIRERVLKQAEEALKGKKKSDGEDKLYKGLHGYTDYKAGFRREQTVASEKAGGAHGPLRASAHIRVSASLRRSGRKKRRHGQKKMFMGLKDDDDERGSDSSDEDDDALPFACFICREPFVDPVVTKCKHYFCEHCALKHHARNKKCFVCNQPTNGIFNTAFEIRKRMAAERK